MQNQQKGFRNVILVATIVVLLGGVGYFTWNKHNQYFYYYNDTKIPLKFFGMKDGRPHFMTKDSTKAEMLLTDEFAVKLKLGATRGELDALNSKYNVSIVKNVYGTNDQFILTVKDDSSRTILDMANLYHNQTIIEWAEPNFIPLSVPPQPF